METITSRNNPKIVSCAKLAQKKHRDSEQLFFFEGRKLMQEAVNANAPIISVFYTEKNREFIKSLGGNFEKISVSDEVYEKISEENSPSGIFCVARHLDRIKKISKITNEEIANPFIAVSVRDPGNLGTIIRNAAAMGIGTLILSSDCADVYNSKCVRAAMGALFRMRILLVSEINSAPSALSERGINVYAATLHTSSVELHKMRELDNVCFAVGNEGHGLDSEFINECAGCVTIPMVKGCESLNVSLASSILMWEQFRKTL